MNHAWRAGREVKLRDFVFDLSHVNIARRYTTPNPEPGPTYMEQAASPTVSNPTWGMRNESGPNGRDLP